MPTFIVPSKKSNHDVIFIDIAYELTNIPEMKKYFTDFTSFSSGYELTIFLKGPYKFIPQMYGFYSFGTTTPNIGGLVGLPNTGVSGAIGYADIGNFGVKKKEDYEALLTPESWEGYATYSTDIKKAQNMKFGRSFKLMMFWGGEPFTSKTSYVGHGRTTVLGTVNAGFSKSEHLGVAGKIIEGDKVLKGKIEDWNSENIGNDKSTSEENSTKDESTKINYTYEF